VLALRATPIKELIIFLKLFKYKLQIVPEEAPSKKGASDEGDESLVDPAQEGEGRAVDNAADSKADKKALKKKRKEEKAAKKEAAAAAKKAAKQKEAKAKAQKSVKDKKQGGGKVPLIVAAACVLVIGSGVGAYFLLWGGSATPEELLTRARDYTDQGEYEKSLDIFNQLIEDEGMEPEIVVQSYLGLADTLLATGDFEAAISTLQAGYEETQDLLISERLDELVPESEEQEPVITNLPIQWRDREFERIVRIALDKPNGNITASDLQHITTLKILGPDHVTTSMGGLNTLNFVDGFRVRDEFISIRGNITNLDDLTHFHNLRRLTIGYNQIRDINGLARLGSLTTLGLYANEIRDISVLSGLTGLQHLYLYNNNISDLSPLRGLTNLQELSLQHNNITDLSPISGLTGLQKLFVSNNNISDLSPLSGLTNLSMLSAQNNSIADLGPVVGLPSLTDVSFANNPVRGLPPAANWRNIL